MTQNNSTAFKTVELTQGTDEWRRWRLDVIGSSDASAIMGENPWKSRAALLDEKLGKTPPFAGNAATRRGTALEPEAREHYQKRRRTTVAPAILRHNDRPWQIASVDGINSRKSIIVEIKCGVKSYEYTERNKEPAKYYYGQLQHILAVTELEKLDYFCYLPGYRPILLTIDRDDRYIHRLNEAELRFYDQMVAGRRSSPRPSPTPIGRSTTSTNTTFTSKTGPVQPVSNQASIAKSSQDRAVNPAKPPVAESNKKKELSSGQKLAILIVCIAIGASLGGVGGGFVGYIISQVILGML